jgi:hypothetical protein
VFVQQEPARKSHRTRNIILIILAGLIGIAILIGVTIWLVVGKSTAEAQKVSDQLITAVQNGDGPAAYALTGPSFREATSEEELTELVTGLSTLVTKDEVSPSGKSINVSTGSGKIAVFTYTMDGTRDGSVYFKTQIRDEEGRWQVMSFRSSETELGTDVE